jgi:outer membrane protein
MKKFNILTVLNSVVLLIIIVLGSLYFLRNKKEQLVYVDNVRLFNEFNMTKDIKIIEERKMTLKGQTLDSLYVIFQGLDNKESDAARNLQMQIATGSKEMQALQDNYTNQLSQQVWNRLNTYIKEYSTSKKLKLVFGTNGNGNVMFGNESMNITDDFIEYSNEKYEGNMNIK